MKKNTIKLSESQLKKVIGNSIKKVLKEWAEPEEGKYYVDRMYYYPDTKSIGGDMSYSINDMAENVSPSPENARDELIEYLQYDLPNWEDEYEEDKPVVLCVTDGNNVINNTYYMSSLDSKYVNEIETALGNGAKVVVINALTNESKLNKVIAESVKKVLREGMTSDNPAYEKWETIKEYLGAEQMLEDIFQYLDSSKLEQIIEWFDQDYDFFDDEEQEEDEEEYM